MEEQTKDFIYKIEITEVNFPEKKNWLTDWDDVENYNEDIKGNEYELFFATFEDMSLKINEITKGLQQYWSDVQEDKQGNNVEYLEYRNSKRMWDKVIRFRTSPFYLNESFWKAIKRYQEGQTK